MFGIGSAVVSGLGSVASIVQTIQQNKAMKAAKQESQAALNQLANIKQQNAMATVQVPTSGTRLAQESMDRGTAANIAAMQQMGPEAAAGLGNVQQANNQSALELGASLDEAKYNRDLMYAQNQQQINKDAAALEADVAGYKLGQANMDYSMASDAKANAIGGIFGGLASGLQYAQQDFDPSTGKYSPGAGIPKTTTTTP
jgi:hypothetical protein